MIPSAAKKKACLLLMFLLTRDVGDSLHCDMQSKKGNARPMTPHMYSESYQEAIQDGLDWRIETGLLAVRTNCVEKALSHKECPNPEDVTLTIPQVNCEVLPSGFKFPAAHCCL